MNNENILSSLPAPIDKCRTPTCPGNIMIAILRKRNGDKADRFCVQCGWCYNKYIL